MVKIVVCRHSHTDETSSDQITPQGAAKAFLMGKFLKKKFSDFDLFIYSGAQRAYQTILIMIAAIGKNYPFILEVDKNFHFGPTFMAIYGNDELKYYLEMNEINLRGKTIEAALTVSTYAQKGREIVCTAIINLAKKMQDQGLKQALVVSHGMWAELAADLSLPYGINECDAICYTVDKGKIIRSQLIKAPRLPSS